MLAVRGGHKDIVDMWLAMEKEPSMLLRPVCEDVNKVYIYIFNTCLKAFIDWDHFGLQILFMIIRIEFYLPTYICTHHQADVQLFFDTIFKFHRCISTIINVNKLAGHKNCVALLSKFTFVFKGNRFFLTDTIHIRGCFLSN